MDEERSELKFVPPPIRGLHTLPLNHANLCDVCGELDE